MNFWDRFRSKEYDTEVRRWDPVSGLATSTFGTVTAFTKSLAGLFVDPYVAYKRVGTDQTKRGNAKAAAAAASKAVGMSVVSMTDIIGKGMLVDTPLALAEGMKNIPKLYGETVADYGKVRDLKSGGVVAAKVSPDIVYSFEVKG